MCCSLAASSAVDCATAAVGTTATDMLPVWTGQSEGEEEEEQGEGEEKREKVSITKLGSQFISLGPTDFAISPAINPRSYFCPREC